ncbi:hypothetical protein PMAYCL1PPCAC_28529, partial [Pristionchus mayeri]
VNRTSVDEIEAQLEELSLVRVGDKQRFDHVLVLVREVELVRVLLGVACADKCVKFTILLLVDFPSDFPDIGEHLPFRLSEQS